MPPAPVWIAPGPLVLELGPFAVGLGAAVLVPQTLLVLLELDPGSSGNVEGAPDRDEGREEDHHVANDQGWKKEEKKDWA